MNSVKLNFKWETLDSDTDRAKVAGGWIVRTIIGDTSIGIAMQFIPDPSHAWEIEEDES